MVLVSMLSISVLNGAARESQPSFPSPAPSLSQQKRRGAVRLQLHVDQQRLEISDRLHLTLSVEAPSQMHIIFPQATARLGPFMVVQQRLIGPSAIAPHTRRWQQEYTLEAMRRGQLTIPPFTVSLQDAETAQQLSPQQLSTDPLTITVTSVVPDDADVTAPKEIAPPVALTRHGMPRWMWGAMGALGSMSLIGSLWWWYRCRYRRSESVSPPRPAHVLALEALCRLHPQDLLNQHDVEEFYMRLSTIIRRYIEWRFRLRAPEQTTEEFLAAVVAVGGLLTTHRALLSTFLEQCDLVKFARHQPSPDDTQRALESARVFVEQTADDQVVVALEGAEGV